MNPFCAWMIIEWSLIKFGSMLIYVLQWRPSWISDRNKKTETWLRTFQWSFIYSLGSVSSLVSEKKIFEISANQSILLALVAMLNIRLERKTETL
jgi:hypothetical protein